MTERSTTNTTVTAIRHVARPSGRGRDNPPNLGDLRQFVKMAEGLPDDVHVFIESSSLNEAGRHDVTFRASYTHPVPEEF